MAKETFTSQEEREQRFAQLQADTHVFCSWKEDSEEGFHVCWEPELEGDELQ